MGQLVAQGGSSGSSATKTYKPQAGCDFTLHELEGAFEVCSHQLLAPAAQSVSFTSSFVFGGPVACCITHCQLLSAEAPCSGTHITHSSCRVDPHSPYNMPSLFRSLLRLQCEFGYKPSSLLLPKGEELPRLYSSLPDTATMLTRSKQQVVQPSPVLHLRLLIRIVLQHGGLRKPPQQQAGGMPGRKGAPAAAAAACGSISGLDRVQLSELTAAVLGVVAGSSLAVKSADESQTAYPVVVVQQAFSKVFGFEPPLNFLGVENFKQLVQVGGA